MGAMILVLSMALGAWEITIPVEGLNEKNAAAFRECIERHFGTLGDDAGQAMLVSVKTAGDVATITMNCPVTVVAFEDVAKALDGSEFKLDLRQWRVTRNACFRWRGAALSAARRAEIEETFAKIGRGCQGAKVESAGIKDGDEHRLILRFDEKGDAPACEIVEVLESRFGAKAWLVWLKGDREGHEVRREKK